jgi:hypothetical protein
MHLILVRLFNYDTLRSTAITKQFTFIQLRPTTKVKFLLCQGVKATYLHSFFPSALDWGKRSASRPSRFTSGERGPDTCGIRVGVAHSRYERVEERKSPLSQQGIEQRFLGHAAHNLVTIP